MPESFKNLKIKFQKVVGIKNCITEKKEIEKYLEDWRGQIKGDTPLILFPESVSHVMEIVSLCNKNNLGITTQGGNTSLCGANMPLSEDERIEIVINTSKLNKIIDIDLYNRSIIVESGCILQTIQEAASVNNLLFPLSLNAEGSCQIGGNISTNAGGVNVLKYGMAREQVMGIEVVLPNGTLFSDLKGLRKDNTGYDLKQLFIGAEGTLGIITKVCLKLYSEPKNICTSLLALNNSEEAIDLLNLTKDSFGDNVSAFEFMSDTCIQAVEKYLPHFRIPLGSKHPWQVIVEIINTEDALILDFLNKHMESGMIIDAIIANNEKEKDDIWKIRHSISEAEKLSGRGIHHDISVPIKKIPEFVETASKAMQEIVGDSIVYTFGHLGDGNLHFTKKQPDAMNEQDFLDKIFDVNRMVHEIAESLGGSFSAEHGIGTKLKDDLVYFSDPVKIQLMQSLKSSIDPKNIMNPNKLI